GLLAREHCVEDRERGADTDPNRVAGAGRQAAHRDRETGHRKDKRDTEYHRRDRPGEAGRTTEGRRPHGFQNTRGHKDQPRHHTPPESAVLSLAGYGAPRPVSHADRPDGSKGAVAAGQSASAAAADSASGRPG